MATQTEQNASDIKRYKRNLRDEVDGTALYRALAGAENNPHLKEVYLRLAASEERHTDLWIRKLTELGATVPHYRPSVRVRVLGWLARRFGTASVSPIVRSMEASVGGMYDNQPEAVEHGLPADERSHARLFREIGKDKETGGPLEIARLEGRHRGASGNALRAAVLGANDGLVSNLSLIMGVAGADPGRHFVLLAGVGGLLAGAFSMALGEWISVRSSSEMFERQVQIEREELADNPEEEEEELTLIYQAKGLAEEQARATAKRILANDETALETLTREELGISADEVGDAWVAAGTSMLMFSIGACLPLIPWLFAGGLLAIVLSASLSGAGLFIVGSATTLYTGRSVLFSGTRMLTFGLGAAALTFGVGRLIGANGSA